MNSVTPIATRSICLKTERHKTNQNGMNMGSGPVEEGIADGRKLRDGDG